MPLFLTFIVDNIHSYYTIILSFILYHSLRLVFLYTHRSLAQQGEPPWGAELRFELGAAFQQADALPTELRRTLQSCAAP